MEKTSKCDLTERIDAPQKWNAIGGGVPFGNNTEVYIEMSVDHKKWTSEKELRGAVLSALREAGVVPTGLATTRFAAGEKAPRTVLSRNAVSVNRSDVGAARAALAKVQLCDS